MVLDGAPLPLDSSIRDFQKGKVGYVANALEQSLLLPRDMADLRTLKKYEVFLTLKRDLAMVSTFVFFFFLFSTPAIPTFREFILTSFFFEGDPNNAYHRGVGR